MIVDGSYMAWVRPTRRVHLALSVGMTVTGVVLIMVGASGGRTADGVVSGDNGTPGGEVTQFPPAPLVSFMAPAPAAAPATSSPGAKPHTKPKPQPPHEPPKPGDHVPHPSDVPRTPAAP